MARSIVLLSDGTGNSAAQIWKTNVWRVYQALDFADGSQVAHYDDGVGSSSFKLLAVIGGAFGYGLKRNIISLYSFVCRHYEPGCQIYCFGFSRGAFTIRMLCGLILREGLVEFANESELRRNAKAAYQAYRGALTPDGRPRYYTVFRIERPLRYIRNTIIDAWKRLRGFKVYDEVLKREVKNIEFLGLWDTVDAYGLPIDELTRGVDLWIWPFSLPDRVLSEKVKRACHALSVDDERTTFHPVLWNEERLENGKAIKERVFPETIKRGKTSRRIRNVSEERISQVWFAGVHANVGGGYPDDALSHVPLDWIMEQAEHHGLVFEKDRRFEIAKAARAAAGTLEGKTDMRVELGGVRNHYARMYDSRHGLAGYYGYLPRRIFDLCHDTYDETDRLVVGLPKIHHSVFERVGFGVDGYAPIVLPKDYAVVARDGEIQYGAANPYEHPRQSTSRAQEQEHVWNLVWWRRVVYFLSVLTSFYLLVFPWIHGARVCADAFCFLSGPIGLLGAVLPEFAGTWIGAFKANTAKFAAAVALFLALYLISGRLQAAIGDRMRAIWRPIISEPPHAVDPVPEPGDFVYWMRTRRLYGRLSRLWKQWILPTIFAFLLVVAALFFASRAAYSVLDARGKICPSSGTAVQVQSKVEGDFLPGTPCWASGWQLKRGSHYRITIAVTEKFVDKRIDTDLQGFDNDKMRWYVRPFALLRRHVGENWFKPIARIGSVGGHEIPLQADICCTGSGLRSRLVTVLKAEADGEFFLYVNDVVVVKPQWFPKFYRNNLGKARVTLEPID